MYMYSYSLYITSVTMQMYLAYQWAFDIITYMFPVLRATTLGHAVKEWFLKTAAGFVSLKVEMTWNLQQQGPAKSGLSSQMVSQDRDHCVEYM